MDTISLVHSLLIKNAQKLNSRSSLIHKIWLFLQLKGPQNKSNPYTLVILLPVSIVLFDNCEKFIRTERTYLILLSLFHFALKFRQNVSDTF